MQKISSLRNSTESYFCLSPVVFAPCPHGQFALIEGAVAISTNYSDYTTPKVTKQSQIQKKQKKRLSPKMQLTTEHTEKYIDSERETNNSYDFLA